jgi:hypothetical protein
MTADDERDAEVRGAEEVDQALQLAQNVWDAIATRLR